MKTLRSVGTLLLLASLATTTLPAQTPPSKPAPKAGSSLQATLEKLEKDGWEAFKKKDKKAYTALCTADYTAVFVDGSVNNLAQALDAMSGFTINHYSLSDVKVTPLGADSALLTYRASLNLTVGSGQPHDVKLGVTDVWVKRGGQWKSIRYHESAIQ